MPFFSFPSSSPSSWTGNAQQYTAMAPGTRQLGVDGEYDSSWQTYDFTGIGGAPANYLNPGGGAGSPLTTYPRLDYSSQSGLDLDWGPFLGYAGMTNESGSSYNLEGQCEIFALISESFVATTEVF